MRKLFYFLFTILIFSNYSCDSAGSDPILCFTPPNDFSFELVDKTTKENLFTNGTFNSKDIVIKNLDDTSKIAKYVFISENNVNLIRLQNIGWQTETINYSISIGKKNIFQFHVEAKRINTECSHTEYSNLEIKNTVYELDQAKEVYKILVDTQN
ncbi:hypothetical protein [Flavobacterium anhuiense]|uniref:hypothetical protein n=1 Tax=Flavobacterium anhuiense TaxID=459526 RepID=UPI003D99C631